VAASNEWTEWHLTPSGWVAGSSKIDFQGVKTVEAPEDRYVTVKYSEYMSSAYSDVKKESRIVWESDDRDLIRELQKQHGECPDSICDR